MSWAGFEIKTLPYDATYDPRRWPTTIARTGRKYSPDQPRDERGRFGEVGDGAPVAQERGTQHLARTGSVGQEKFNQSSVTSALDEAAKVDQYVEDIQQGGAYPNAEEWGNYADVERDDEGMPVGISETHWEPGTVASLSEAASQWQESFEKSENIQIAADALLGHEDLARYEAQGMHVVYPDSAAQARELLTAMAGDGPDGAASGYALGDEPMMQLLDFSKGELSRGVADPDGEILAAFRDAHDNGTTVSWAMASFVQGGDQGDARMQYMADEMGDAPQTWEDSDTGIESHQTGSMNAASIALHYTVPGNNVSVIAPEAPDNPILILGEGKALTVDGNFEALMGGKFSVTDIHDASQTERDVWRAQDMHIAPSDSLTVVRIKQVENVKLPPGVSTR